MGAVPLGRNFFAARCKQILLCCIYTFMTYIHVFYMKLKLIFFVH